MSKTQTSLSSPNSSAGTLAAWAPEPVQVLFAGSRAENRAFSFCSLKARSSCSSCSHSGSVRDPRPIRATSTSGIFLLLRCWAQSVQWGRIRVGMGTGGSKFLGKDPEAWPVWKGERSSASSIWWMWSNPGSPHASDGTLDSRCWIVFRLPEKE